MTLVAGLGLALVAAAVVIVLGVTLVAVLPAALRLRSAALVTRALVEEYRASVTSERWRAQEQALERAVLLRPLRRIRRVATHPLVVALLESYRRRRARARAAGANA